MGSTNMDVQTGERLFEKGEMQEALLVFNRVLSKDPYNLAALNNRGVLMHLLGRHHQADQAFCDVLARERHNADAVYNLIASYQVQKRWTDAQAVVLEYGKYLSEDDLKQISTSLEEEVLTAVPEPESGPSRGDYAGMQGGLAQAMQRELFFIVGCPKSGTTWLQQILNGHPQILCGGESNLNLARRLIEDLSRMYNRDILTINKTYIGQGPYATLSPQDNAYLFGTVLELLFANLARTSGVECIGFKNPDHLANMEASAGLFGQIKYVHIIRDGRDVAVSGWFHNLRTEKESFQRLYPGFPEYARNLAQAWVEKIKRARAFGERHPQRYFELRYEDLHQRPDEAVSDILTFLGVDVSPEAVAGCCAAGSFERLSGGRRQGEEDRGAFFRKGIVGDWKNHFDTHTLSDFEAHTAELLRGLGYET